MRRSLFLGIAVGLLGLPMPADAIPTASTVSLPKLPTSTRDFDGLVTTKVTLIWRLVGPQPRAHVRIWRLAGTKWRVAATTDRRPTVLDNGVIDACPYESFDHGRTFKRYFKPCHDVLTREPKTIVANGIAYRAVPDLNALIFQAPGLYGWTPTSPAFAWDPEQVYGESVPDFAAFSDPLRLVLYRERDGSRGTALMTAYRSLDGGATWQAGSQATGRFFAADAFGGGRLYGVNSTDPGTGPPPTTFSHSNDLGATWQTLVLAARSTLGAHLQLGTVPGVVAVVGDLIWVTDNGAASARSVATVPRGWRIMSTPGNFGSWLLIGKDSIRRVTLNK
jgi:hypothetical protein